MNFPYPGWSEQNPEDWWSAVVTGIPELLQGFDVKEAAGIGTGGCNISLGTSGTIFISSDTFGADSNNALHAFCHADGGYHLMGCNAFSGKCSIFSG